MSSTSLKITEIFHSLQGESSTVGLPTTFVRLTGCPLRCSYCDTEYAFYGGERLQMEDIVQRVVEFGAPWVTVTGGEPLAQRSCLELLTRLCDMGFKVSLETSGALSIAGVDARVRVVLDLKTPGSGEAARNLYSNLALLKDVDELKFVICDRGDYEWARLKIDELNLARMADRILMSPSHGTLSGPELAGWMLEDRIPFRFQLQLHKVLWQDAKGR